MLTVRRETKAPVGETPGINGSATSAELGHALEEREFDVAFANRIAKLEAFNKHLYRPNTYLHKWWARRCGSTFRLILKHLVEDPTRWSYYAPGGLEGKVVLDPMMGGGTTLHEAIRMGAGVIGADIDPIPILQARATLSDLPLEQLESAFERFHAALRGALAPLYHTVCPQCSAGTEMQFALYGLRRYCDCGPRIFVDSTILRHEPDGSVIRICPSCLTIGSADEPCACALGEMAPLLVEKGARVCGACGGAYRDDFEQLFYSRYEQVAVAGRCHEHGLFFVPPSPADQARRQEAEAQRDQLGFYPAEFGIEAGPKSTDLLRRGVRSYLDLFSSRQLLYLRHAVDLLPFFPLLVRLNLALLVSTSLEFNSMLCGYKGGDRRRPGAIRHTFSHHAYSFPYTALENNPLYEQRTSGTLQNLFDGRIRRARLWARQPIERVFDGERVGTEVIHGEMDAGVEVQHAKELRGGPRRFFLIQGSSASLPLPSDSVDYVVTDPPYFDSVQYSDLAGFFRVWLKQLPPTEVDWHYDFSDSAVDPQANGNGQYARVLAAIFGECHRLLKKDRGVLAFTFHHWNPKGWASLTWALQQAGFRLREYHIVHSENPTSVHIVNQKALVHDAVLFLVPWEADGAGHWALPVSIDRSDSQAFCHDCAAALGWMLEADLDANEISRRWDMLL
jgi:hypothetical protein